MCKCQAAGDGVAEALLTEAIGEAQAALGDLRDLAPGSIRRSFQRPALRRRLRPTPMTLHVRVDLRMAANGRLPAAVEMAAYVLVVGAGEDAAIHGATHAVVSAVQDDGRLVVTVEHDGPTSPISPSVALADRIGAIGGSLEVEPTRLRAELPCE